ncbi:hypothetical protein GQ53DRAFT_841071 [Thozetella sp. PMI_491]|nr:hypothetical protein GQ53DRAFT_841071 [Thozetella sp. PMI_491]
MENHQDHLVYCGTSSALESSGEALGRGKRPIDVNDDGEVAGARRYTFVVPLLLILLLAVVILPSYSLPNTRFQPPSLPAMFLSLRYAAQLVAVTTVWAAPSRRDFLSVGPQDRHGYLEDGTEYQIRIPANWTGALINDLDAVTNLASNSSQALAFLGAGYAYSGTSRRPDRDFHFDPRAERDEQAQVIDIFMQEFGKPDHIVQFGCSGGGGVALGVAEAFADLVDGAVSSNGGEGIVMSNQRLDLLFALKALIAPSSSLPLVGISYEDRQAASQAWNATLATALSTPEGRAKILLSGAVAQAPQWGGAFAPYLGKPSPENSTAVLEAMLRSVTDAAIYAAGIRYLYDNPAGIMSWNAGIDYKHFYHKAQGSTKDMVEALYKDTGLKLADDLATINAYPRIERNETAVSYWVERALTGDPKIPVLQVNTLGDSTRSSALMAAYAAGVEDNGESHLYRQALVESAGHCTWNSNEAAVAVQTVSKRLTRGNWGSITSADNLNEFARENGLGITRFINPSVLPKKNNREFFSDDASSKIGRV